MNAFCKASEKAGFFAERVIEQTARERTQRGGRIHTPMQADGSAQASARSEPTTKDAVAG